MFNIFLTVFFVTLASAFVDPFFFIGFLIGIAISGLFQAIFMANAGGAWDNAKKIVETELQEKGTELHAATVVGDTVGDPFKDTSSVAMNPIIKFATLFGLLAVELAVRSPPSRLGFTALLAAVFFVVSVVFVWRSFYAMRIKIEGVGAGAPHRAQGRFSSPGGRRQHVAAMGKHSQARCAGRRHDLHQRRQTRADHSARGFWPAART